MYCMVLLRRNKKSVWVVNRKIGGSVWVWGRVYEVVEGNKKKGLIFVDKISYVNFLISMRELLGLFYKRYGVYCYSWGLGYKMRWVRVGGRRHSFFRFNLGYSGFYYIYRPKGLWIKVYDKKTMIFFSNSSSLLYEFYVHILYLRVMNIYREKGMKKPDKIYIFKETGKQEYIY